MHFIEFHKPLSSNLRDWADFGAYFGGTIGVILSGLNFFAIAYLTIKMNRKQDQQWLTQLRFTFYKDIIERAYSLTEETIKNQQVLHSYILWLQHTDFKNILFLIHDVETNHLHKLKEELLTILIKIKSNQNFSVQPDTDLIEQFTLAKIKFTNYLGAIMMDQTRKQPISTT